jgi:aromatic-L-amino-acid decarboxylase
VDKNAFRKLGYEFVDWLADYFETVECYPVVSRVKPGEIKAGLPASPPSKAETPEAVFRDFKEKILPGITHWQHPGWFGYFPANNSPASVLAELLSAGLGVQGMVWQTSPAAAELEELVLDWLRQMIGLPPGFSGVIQDTASTATLCALISARERATGFRSNHEGLKEPLIVYASDQTHSSIEKGVKIAGYGRDNLRLISTDTAYAMVSERLEAAVIEDKKKGLKPACVVATIGTTSSTAIDPLPAIGKICRRYGLWLHVDAAFAGSAAILPEMRWLLQGAEAMDSFVFNPHKWLFTNFDCSAYFVKDPGMLIRTFEIHPEYLKTGVDPHVKNYRDWGIQLGRRFRALKLWFVIRTYGVEGLQSILREHIRLGQLFKGWVEEHDMFELMAPVPLSLVCFRLNDGRNPEVLNALNKRLLDNVNSVGRIFLTHTTLRGRYVLRMAIGQRTTQERHVRDAWDLITEKAAELLKS